MSGRVLPVSTSDNYDDDPSLHKESSSPFTALWERLERLITEMKAMCTLENLKGMINWFLDSANLKVSLSVRKMTMMPPV